VPLPSSFFLLFLHGPTYDPAKSQLVEIPRDRTSANSIASYRRTRDNSHGRLNRGKYDRSMQRSQKFRMPARNVVAVLSLHCHCIICDLSFNLAVHVRQIVAYEESVLLYAISYVCILPARKLHFFFFLTLQFLSTKINVQLSRERYGSAHAKRTVCLVTTRYRRKQFAISFNRNVRICHHAGRKLESFGGSRKRSQLRRSICHISVE